jgi:hypothetical protein
VLGFAAVVVLHWLSLPPAAVCVVLQFRSSRGVERQQLRWVAAGAAAAVIGLAVSLPSGLGLGYAAVVLGLGRLVGQGSSLAVAAATTPPAPWRRSRPGCATRSTWTRCTASCWPWSTRPCSPPGLAVAAPRP